MLYEEFKKLAKGMKSIWTKQDFLPDAYALDIWYALLKDLPYEQTNIAVQRYASTSKWPPTPADIREQIVIINDETTDWGSAWQTVMSAIGRYGTYQKQAALDSMDEITQMTIKRLGWRNICQADQSENMSIRANFRAIYEELQRKAREEAQVPEKLRAKIATITGREVKQIE